MNTNNLLPINQNLQKEISILNTIPTNIFEIMCTNEINLKNGLKNENVINTLMKELNLDAQKVEHLWQCISHINKHYNDIILKPNHLKLQLVNDLKMSEEKSDIFVKLWSERVVSNFDLNKRTTLKNVSWELLLQSGSNVSQHEAIPNAKVILNVENKNKCVKPVIFEIHGEELLHLSEALDCIQRKLDMTNIKI